jgi:hypothetical protein
MTKFDSVCQITYCSEQIILEPNEPQADLNLELLIQVKGKRTWQDAQHQ